MTQRKCQVWGWRQWTWCLIPPQVCKRYRKVNFLEIFETPRHKITQKCDFKIYHKRLNQAFEIRPKISEAHIFWGIILHPFCTQTKKLMWTLLTKLFQHLVTFIKDEVLDMLEIKCFLACQSQYSARCANDNVWAVGLEGLLVLLDADATKEHWNFDVIHVFRKSFILFRDLKGQLSCVAHNQHTDLTINLL